MSETEAAAAPAATEPEAGAKEAEPAETAKAAEPAEAAPAEAAEKPATAPAPEAGGDAAQPAPDQPAADQAAPVAADAGEAAPAAAPEVAPNADPDEPPKSSVKKEKIENLDDDEVKEGKQAKGKKGKKGKKDKTVEADAAGAKGDADDKEKKSKKSKKATKAEKPAAASKRAPPPPPPKTKAQLAQEAAQAEREKREAERYAREMKRLALLDEEEEDEEEVEEEQTRQRKKYHRKEQKEPKKSEAQITPLEKHGRKKHSHHGGEEFDEEEASSDWDDDMMYDMVSYEDEDDGVYAKVKLTEKQLKHIYRAIKSSATSGEEEESTSESSDVPDYVYQRSLEEIPDFFEMLGEVPFIEDISLTTSESERQKEQADAEELIDVNSPEYQQKMALEAYMREMNATGSDDSLRRREAELRGEHEFEDEEEEFSAEEGSVEDSSEASVMPYDPELDHLPQYSEDLPFLVAAGTGDGQDVLQELLVMEVEKVVPVEEVDQEELDRLEQQRILHELTHEFLRALITKTLEFCEAEAETTRIMKKLDKRLMMDELMGKLESLSENTAQLKWLNRRATEFYRRKKAYRYITEDAIEVIAQNKAKYFQQLKILDESLARLKKTHQLRTETITKLREEQEQSQENYTTRAAELDRLIRRALQRENYPKLNELVDQDLAKMFELHKEVSDMRLSVIEKQHTIGYYMKKFAEMNDLGEGLHMADFEYLQTDVQALSKKVEERNTELNKCHLRFNDDLHITAHIKEKQERYRLTIYDLDEQLADLVVDKMNLRERVHEATLIRKDTRIAIRNATVAGGLLYRPNLMQDYDKTLRKARRMRENIEQLKRQIIDLEQKISFLENMSNDEQQLL